MTNMTTSINYPDQSALALHTTLQYKEPMASAALNRNYHNIIKHGIYEGFDIVPAGGLTATIAGTGDRHTAAARHADITLTIHAQHPTTLTLTAGTTGAIVLDSFYQYGVATKQVDNTSNQEAAEYKIIDIADLEPQQVVIAEFDIPGGTTTLTAGMFSYDNRSIGIYGVEDHEGLDDPHEQYEREDNAASDAEIDAESTATKHVKLSQLWRGIDLKTGQHVEASDPHEQYVKKAAQKCTDWNDATTTGFWMASDAANAPDADWFIGTVVVHNASWLTQTLHQFTLDDSSDAKEYRRDMNNGTWGAWRKLLSAEKQIRATACPVGVPLPWPTDVAPSGFAMMKGQAFDTGAYPELYAAYPSGYIPDMRDLAVVGKGDGETVLSYEGDSLLSHSHTITVNSTELGTKTTTSDTHNHSLPSRDNANGGDNYIEDASDGTARSAYTGNDTHNHTVTLGSHAHSASASSTGGAENTIKNRKFNWIVRLA